MSTDVLISFDTTGSMYPCLAEVRRKIEAAVTRLFRELPGLRIGIIAHGDYCDAQDPRSYVTKHFPFSNNPQEINRFVHGVGKTNGGDRPECYELVLHEARDFDWKAERRVMVLIGDDVPHRPGEAQNYKHLKWDDEATSLRARHVTIHAVQCLNYSGRTYFYEALARLGRGRKIDLHQFRDIVELIMAVCYQAQGGNFLEQFTNELAAGKAMNRGIATFLQQLGAPMAEVKTKFVSEPTGLIPVPPSRFQILPVPNRCIIRGFVESTGAEFAPGRGFYQLTKRVLVQERKEVVLVDKETGDMFTGADARDMIGLPYGSRGKVNPGDAPRGYIVFIQSTSYNRVLLPGTQFLWEVS